MSKKISEATNKAALSGSELIPAYDALGTTKDVAITARDIAHIAQMMKGAQLAQVNDSNSDQDETSFTLSTTTELIVELQTNASHATCDQWHVLQGSTNLAGGFTLEGGKPAYIGTFAAGTYKLSHNPVTGCNITLYKAVEAAAGESALTDLTRDFGKYADMADKTLTLVNSGKRFDSTGALVDATGWAVGKLGAVVVGNTYELYMQSSEKMVLGTALFVAHTQETVGTEVKDVYTPLFSAKSTDIPASGYVCLEAMKAYEEVLVSYRTDVTGANVIKVRRYGTKASIATQMSNMQQEIERKTDMNGLYDGLTAGAALRLVPHGEAATKEVIGLGGRKSGGKNAIDADINARISCIKGYTLMWRQQIPDAGTSGLEGGKITIGGTYTIKVNGSWVTANRPYLVCNPTDTAAEDVIEGVTVAAGWSVIRVGTEQEVAFAAGWKLIDLLLTFGAAKGHELGSKTTADVAEAMGYVATESGKTAFDAWQAHTEQFAADMAYSAQTVIRNGRWDGLRSVGKDGDGNAFDFTRSIEQILRQFFKDGMNGIGIGTDSEVCDTIEAGRVDVAMDKYVFTGNEVCRLSSVYFVVSVPVNMNQVASKATCRTTKYNGIGISPLNQNSNLFVAAADKNTLYFRNYRYTSASEFINSLKGDTLLFERNNHIITPITELNLTYPVSNTEGVETPVCEPSTNCAPLAANITYGLDAYATIVDLKKRVEALEKK